MARETEWSKVPFGAKVRAWWAGDGETKYIGKFLACDEADKELQFLVFIEHGPDAQWFDCCEIIEEVI